MILLKGGSRVYLNDDENDEYIKKQIDKANNDLSMGGMSKETYVWYDDSDPNDIMVYHKSGGDIALFFKNTEIVDIDLSRFNFSNVDNMTEMFYDCTNLKNIKFGEHFTTRNVTKMMRMFCGCSNLETLNLNKFQTHKLVAVEHMFDHCPKLRYINLQTFTSENIDFNPYNRKLYFLTDNPNVRLTISVLDKKLRAYIHENYPDVLIGELVNEKNEIITINSENIF